MHVITVEELYVHMIALVSIFIRDRPIMLIYLPIMLCCSAHKIYLLCSILCSSIRIVLGLLSLFMYKFS